MTDTLLQQQQKYLVEVLNLTCTFISGEKPNLFRTELTSCDWLPDQQVGSRRLYAQNAHIRDRLYQTQKNHNIKISQLYTSWSEYTSVFWFIASCPDLTMLTVWASLWRRKQQQHERMQAEGLSAQNLDHIHSYFHSRFTWERESVIAEMVGVMAKVTSFHSGSQSHTR